MNKILILGVLAVVAIGGFLIFGSKQTVQEPIQNTEHNMPAMEDSGMMGSEEKKVVKEFTIESKGLNFSPNEIKVNVGDTVRITYKNTVGKHDFTLDEFNVKTQLLDAGQEEAVEFVADAAGSYEFYCSVAGHRAAGMKGTLVVEEF